jgi:hypothetical protein
MDSVPKITSLIKNLIRKTAPRRLRRRPLGRRSLDEGLVVRLSRPSESNLEPLMYEKKIPRRSREENRPGL